MCDRFAPEDNEKIGKSEKGRWKEDERTLQTLDFIATTVFYSKMQKKMHNPDIEHRYKKKIQHMSSHISKPRSI